MREILKATSLNCKTGVSAFVSRRTVIAYWLIPAEPARSFFQAAINDLALRFDAPPFEPHVTVHVGANDIDATEKALSTAAHECQPLKLNAGEISHSSEFIKTLYVQFALNTELRKLNEIICDAAQDSSDYELKPHLSLLYKKMPGAALRQLAGSITVLFSEVIFDALKAVCCISPTQTRADVEAWRVAATRDLSAQ
jgi:putative hydrolase of the HAD superfamily